MIHRLLPFWLVLAVLQFSCSSIKELTSESIVTAEILQAGLINAYPEGTKNADGSIAYCESSAIANLGDRLLIASDKVAPNPDVSSIFSIPFPKSFPAVINAVEYHDSPLLSSAIKIESMAKSPVTDIFFAATAFDRIKTDSPEWDAYNRLLYWEAGNSENARVLFRTEDQGILSSKSVREALHRVIRNRKYPNGVSYFKIEGLAVLKDNRILFGIREMGRSYEDFDYSFMIISTSFIQSTSGLVVDPALDKVFEFNPSEDTRIGKKLGLSALEYHEPSNSIVAITTHETEGGDFASYIWMMPLEKRLTMRTKPILVLDENDQPLMIPHKAEGFCFLNKVTMFVICDEDRLPAKVKTNSGIMTRAPHQGVYTVIKIKT